MRSITEIDLVPPKGNRKVRIPVHTSSSVKRNIVLSLSILFVIGFVSFGSIGVQVHAATLHPLKPDVSNQVRTWAQQAEAKCDFYYINRGKPPKSQSGKLGDDMALAEKWHGDLADRTARRLEAIPGAPSAGVRMIRAMRTYAKTSWELAVVFSEGGYQPRKMAEIQARRQPAQRQVQNLSVSLRTPSCYSVVNTPE